MQKIVTNISKYLNNFHPLNCAPVGKRAQQSLWGADCRWEVPALGGGTAGGWDGRGSRAQVRQSLKQS